MPRRRLPVIPWRVSQALLNAPRRSAAALMLALLACPLPAAAREAQAPPLTVDRVVVLMRHGVRPPTKDPAMPAGIATDPWPSWPVAPGWLTPHGAEAVARLAVADGVRFRALDLLPPTGCPAPSYVSVYADSDQRTIATAEAWIGALAPGCGIVAAHRPQGERDPLFDGIADPAAGFDPLRADAEVAQAIGPGGLAALDRRERPLLARLDRILCGQTTVACGVSAMPSAIMPAAPGKRPRLSGAIDRASTAAQILLLEYAEGKPMADIGWGRAAAADVTTLSHFHALEFRLLARPRAIAAPNFAGLAQRVTMALSDTSPQAARVTLIVGHDTNVANLGGLLGVHWHVPGFAEDDPAPGGAIILERLSDATGAQFVRAVYRSQTLEQLRSAEPLAGKDYREVLPISGCRAPGIAGLCSIAELTARLAPDRAEQDAPTPPS